MTLLHRAIFEATGPRTWESAMVTSLFPLVTNRVYLRLSFSCYPCHRASCTRCFVRQHPMVYTSILLKMFQNVPLQRLIDQVSRVDLAQCACNYSVNSRFVAYFLASVLNRVNRTVRSIFSVITLGTPNYGELQRIRHSKSFDSKTYNGSWLFSDCVQVISLKNSFPRCRSSLLPVSLHCEKLPLVPDFIVWNYSD